MSGNETVFLPPLHQLQTPSEYGDMITIALYQLEPPFEYSDVISVPLYQLQSPSEYSDAITTLNVIW